uniref:Uncharacterized protein n=1 Tax=Caenorhabditis japonica TaxID=281687 RepID=A0A8R1IR39_CAEJA
MLQRHQEYCTLMMDDPRYQQLRRENVSVAVLDHFLQRCQNVLFHIAIAVTRFVQMRTLDALFTRKQYPWIQVELNEAQRPIFAGRSELIFEAVRPD